MSDKVFLDTNVLVYLFDAREPAKRQRATELLQRLADADDAMIISTQVLQEGYVALTRKLGMDASEALALLEMMKDVTFTVHIVDAALVFRSARRSMALRVSFWDALIIETAIEAGCGVLYSEDLQHGRAFGALTVMNPFV